MCSDVMVGSGTEDPTIAEINDQIELMKKKIQLSESRRKAHFEECTTEMQQNAETIRNLKKEIKELQAEMSKPAKHDLVILEAEDKPEREVSQLLNKSPQEVIVILNDQIMDQRRKLDIMSYNLKKDKARLQNLDKEYHKLMDENSPSAIAKRAAPVKKQISDLENEIQRLNLNIEESMHLQKKYKNIEDSLLEDRVYYDSILNSLEADMEKQKAEIKQLQEVKREAIELRDKTKRDLNKLEEEVARGAAIRQAQVDKLRKLLEQGKADLERVEKSLAGTRPPPDPEYPIEDDSELIREEKELQDAFDKLQKVTGANSPEEVLQKVINQKETRTRLTYLKNKVEMEKQRLEENNSNMAAQIEAYKFSQVKDKQESEEELRKLEEEIAKEKEECEQLTKEYERDKEIVEKLKEHFYNFSVQMKDLDGKPVPEITEETECLEALVTNVEEKMLLLMELTKDIDVNDIEGFSEDEPLDETGILDCRGGTTGAAGAEGAAAEPSSPRPVVPTREFLKRQSQLIVEAHTRKNKPYK